MEKGKGKEKENSEGKGEREEKNICYYGNADTLDTTRERGREREGGRKIA